MFGPCYGLRLPWFSRFRRQKRNRNDLSPEWLALSNELSSRSDKIALSRILHFCSAHEIDPSAVTKETFDDYRCRLDRSLLESPDQTFALTVKAWRTAELAVKNWSRVSVAIPDRRKYWVPVGPLSGNPSPGLPSVV